MSHDNEYFEREYDDHVYEDDYYEEHYEEEELEAEDEEELIEEDDELDDEESTTEKRINRSFACEDCDYRWDDYIIKTKGNLEDEDEDYSDVVCPMCGSINVEQI